jgi:hypothetical protein
MSTKYNKMAHILNVAHCRLLKNEIVDDRINLIEQSVEFQEFKKLYEEQSPSYWKNLKLIGECVDLALLNARKKALQDLWRKIYDKNEFKKSHSKSKN